MSACPVCGIHQNSDDQAFEWHVNAHFEQGKSSSGGGGGSRSGTCKEEQEATDRAIAETLLADQMRGMEDDGCVVCGLPLDGMSESGKRYHVNQCLDAGSTNPDDRIDYARGTALKSGQLAHDNTVDSTWDGPARPGSWTDWVGKKVDKGDRWWDPIAGDPRLSEVPNNMSPGVISVLSLILHETVKQKVTRSAVLSRDIVHIKGSFGFDLGWGCGYRNALMGITSLILALPEYRATFSRARNGSDPGVRRVQGWIEEAWAAGFDTDGRDQLKGRVLGTRKWIGTSDLYSMFSYLGVPCKLYDFPKPPNTQMNRKATHQILQQWVKRYFAEDHPIPKEVSAYDVLMRSGNGGQGRGEAVRMSTKFPLILQHSGHSRTIVGYEENSRGDINLLLFDPGKTIPKDLRTSALARVRQSRLPLLNTATPTNQTHEPIQFSPPYTNGASEIHPGPTSTQSSSSSPSKKKRRTDTNHVRGQGSSSAFGIEIGSDEEVEQGGWVRKKLSKVLHRASGFNAGHGSGGGGDGLEGGAIKSLSHFRLNLGLLSSHTEYQVLAFTGGPILTPGERDQRKVPKSTPIKE